MEYFDAIVVGLGGMGSAAVAHLARRNVKVLGLEQFTPVHARGSSHGESRVIRQSYFEHPDYVPLLLRAYELWEALERETNSDLMTLTGGLMIGEAHSHTVTGSCRSAREHGLPHEMLDAHQIRSRFPAFAPDVGLVGLYEKNAGYVRPERCIRAHLDQASRYGAQLRFEEPVLEWKARSQSVILRTQAGTYETASLVLTPGAWAPRLFQLELPLSVVRQHLFWIEPRAPFELFDSSRFPIFIWEVHPQLQFYGFPLHGPVSDGIKIAIFYVHEPCQPESMHASPSPSVIETLRVCLQDRIPSLSGQILRSVACMYTNTPDHHFVIGKHPHHPNVTIASPCSGHGFKFCSVMGEVLADLALDNQTRHAIDMFSPDRFRANST
jgi:sarcosine oxidase